MLATQSSQLTAWIRTHWRCQRCPTINTNATPLTILLLVSQLQQQIYPSNESRRRRHKHYPTNHMPTISNRQKHPLAGTHPRILDNARQKPTESHSSCCTWYRTAEFDEAVVGFFLETKVHQPVQNRGKNSIKRLTFSNGLGQSHIHTLLITDDTERCRVKGGKKW